MDELSKKSTPLPRPTYEPEGGVVNPSGDSVSENLGLGPTPLGGQNPTAEDHASGFETRDIEHRQKAAPARRTG